MMKILLATDGSAQSEEAARFVAGLELSEDDEVTVLHVIGGAPPGRDEAAHQAALMEIKRKIAPRVLDSALQAMGPLPARVSTALVEGDPDRGIIEAAEEAGADLVVMGPRGMKGIKLFLIGSTTMSVAMNSPISTLIVKPSAGEGGRMRVLLATDGSDYADNAAQALASMPLRGDTGIIVLSVLWTSYADIPERFAGEIDERAKEAVAAMRSSEYLEADRVFEKSRRYLSRRFTDVEGVVKIGDPSDEILKASEEFSVDMIALGSRGLRGIRGMLGSVSRNVLIHAQCPVLVGKGG
jgi:universal stress protein E